MKPVPHGEPYAGKLHVRFDEGAGVPDKGRSALLYTLFDPTGVFCASGSRPSRSSIRPNLRLTEGGWAAILIDDRDDKIVSRRRSARTGIVL